jgi:mono/diheme cytochrome c family protein
MRLILPALAAGLVLAGCQDGTQKRTETASTRVVMREMGPLPDGVVPRGGAAARTAVEGPGPDVTPAVLARGGERYRIFCTPCHGDRGDGDGAIVRRGYPAPPPLRPAAPEDVVATITNGRGFMFPYGARIPPDDRWAIAHHVMAFSGAPSRPPAEEP